LLQHWLIGLSWLGLYVTNDSFIIASTLYLIRNNGSFHRIMAKTRRKFTQCPNCGYTFEEVNNYCPNCGQENHDLNVPVKHLIEEFFEGTLHYDNKFWLTIKYLLTRPGYLTERFTMGQRASYVPPFRLYVFVSIFFFTALALRASESFIVVSEDDLHEKLAERDPEAAAQLQNVDSLAAAVVGRIASPEKPANQEHGALGAIEAFEAKYKGNEELYKQKLLRNISFMMFVLMPFFGFILYLFFRKQGRNYVEHLMFSIHFHVFCFLLTIIAFGVELVYEGFNVDRWVLWISLIYLFLAIRRVYKESYLLTFAKLIPISFIYLLSLGFLSLGTLAISILLG
jgi:hypothetical protein